jgi:hypothetical protein
MFMGEFNLAHIGPIRMPVHIGVNPFSQNTSRCKKCKSLHDAKSSIITIDKFLIKLLKNTNIVVQTLRILWNKSLDLISCMFQCDHVGVSNDETLSLSSQKSLTACVQNIPLLCCHRNEPRHVRLPREDNYNKTRRYCFVSFRMNWKDATRFSFR